MEGGGGGGGGLPPGFRFYPTEEELISFYLKKKIQSSGTQDVDRVIPQIDVYEFNPWELPQYAGERCRGDPEQWFFFIPRQEKEARGGRPCRLTSSGYWKATGSPSSVYSSDHHRVIGMKRTMVFYTGRAPTGKKTEWKMNEYKATQEEASLKNNTPPKLMQEISLCRLYIKSKSLRSFDRRPSAAAPSESGTVQQSGESNDQATTSSHLNHLSLIEGMKRSPDHSSNSSGEHATNPSDYSTMEIDSELSWDWEEHINWF